MKTIKNIIFSSLFVVAFFTIFSPNTVYSQSSGCSQFFAVVFPPPPAAPAGVDIVGEGCSQPSVGNYRVVVYYPSPPNPPGTSLSFDLLLEPDSSGVVELYQPGNGQFRVELYDGLTMVQETYFAVGEELAPIPIPPGGTGLPEGLGCNGDTGIDSAIGCIPVSTAQGFSRFVLLFSIGVGSGTSILLFAYGSGLVGSSMGAPRKLQVGQEVIFSAVAGLITLAFSAYLLRLIGVSILNIPGF